MNLGPLNYHPKVDPIVDAIVDPTVDPKVDPKTDPKVDSKVDPKMDPNGSFRFLQVHPKFSTTFRLKDFQSCFF